ncbi:MAG: response regulator [Sphingosinicella sp.]|nr:response regulator [Sphingosinicella sp.]
MKHPQDRITSLLVVEDNPGDARLLREVFNEDGARSTVMALVGSMEAAEKHLAAHNVDIILLDLGLPDAHGLEAVRRAHAAAPAMPIVVLSGLDDERVAVEALQDGAQDYLIKGQIDSRSLLRALRYAIERKRLEEVARALGAKVEAAQDRSRNLQNELIQMSRLSAMGAMASTLSHELNQPLMALVNYLRGSIRLLEDPNPDALDQVRAALQEGEKNALRAGEIIRRARQMVIKGHPKQETAELAGLVQDALELAIVNYREELVLDIHYSPGIQVLVDSVQIQQVVLNLVRNAVEAMAGCAERTLSIRTELLGDMTEVSIADRGPGLSPEVRQQLFTPFVTSKREGMGVGLSISRTIVEAHHGRIIAEDRPGGGTIMRFTLPVNIRTLGDAQNDAGKLVDLC